LHKLVAYFATFFGVFCGLKTSSKPAIFQPPQILEKQRFDNMLLPTD